MLAISPQLKDFFKSSRVLWLILWLAMTFSMLFYPIVMLFISQRQPPTELPDGLYVALIGVAAVATLISLLLSKFLPSDTQLRDALNRDFDAEGLARNPQTDLVDEGRLQKIELVPSYERKFLLLPALYFTPFVLRLVINEAIAIFGFVLSFLSHSLDPMLPFVGVAIILNLTTFPRIEPLVGRASRLVR